MSNDIRVAFIGCGGNARGHGSRIAEIEGVEIVALVDPSENSLNGFKERVGLGDEIPTFSDHQKMLAEVKPNAVVISTPHTLHFQQIMDSLDAGCHVHTEKPMVCTVAHAKQVIQKIEETGLHLMIGYQRHLQPSYMYCRQVVQSGELGKAHFITAHQCQNWYRAQQGAWRQSLALSGGGQLNDSGSHLIDILLWILEASPSEVYAMMDYMNAEVDILTAMSIKFNTGALCTIGVVGHAVGGMSEDFTIWLENGTLFVREGKVYREEQGTGRVEVSADKLPEGANKDVTFIELIRGERKDNPIDAHNGLRVIQLTEAAWKSADTRQAVKVDLS
jgi:predicted dehydrogenase